MQKVPTSKIQSKEHRLEIQLGQNKLKNPTNFLVHKAQIKISAKPNEKKLAENHCQARWQQTPQSSFRLNQSIVDQRSRKNIKLDLDNRLNRVYSSLVKHSWIQPKNHTVSDQQSSIMKDHKLYSPFTDLESSMGQIHKQLPYQLLKVYIKGIYQEYQIRDPLLSYGNDMIYQSGFQKIFEMDGRMVQTPMKSSSECQKMNQESTKKKIIKWKKNCLAQVKVCDLTQKKQFLKIETPKKIATQHPQNTYCPQYIHQNPIRESSKRQKLSRTLKAEQDGSRYQRSKGLNLQTNPYEEQVGGKQRQRNYTKALADTRLTMSQVNDNVFNSRRYQLQSSVIERRKLANSFSAQEQHLIKQCFRYCFVCEQSILQANISFHQKSCQGLKQILSSNSLTKEELVRIINQKIKKIQRQLEQVLMKNQQQETSKLLQIKSRALDWIKTINNEERSNVAVERRQSLLQCQKINRIIQSSTILRTFELVNKLNWFIHLRKNFVLRTNKLISPTS